MTCQSVSGSPELGVGDPARLAVGRAVRASLLLAAVFVVFTWTAKEVPALYERVPWQDDPYDALISFTIFTVPVLAGLCLVRAPLCRRQQPLPARRAIDLLRASRVLAGAVMVTFAGEWVSVALQAHRSAWTAVTAVLTGVLALLTVLACLVAAQIRYARRRLPADIGVPAQPDWLADAAALGEQAAARLARRHHGAGKAAGWLGRALPARIRQHPAASAAAVALTFGVLSSASQAAGEGYQARAALLFLVIAASSIFGFLLAAGTRLRIAQPRGPRSGQAVNATVAACTAIWLTFAFRNALLSSLGLPRHHALAATSELALAAAIVAGSAVLAAGFLRRSHDRQAQRRRNA